MERPIGLAAGMVAGLLLAGAAFGATFNAYNSGSSALLGSFNAPEAGGQVAAASFLVAGITFSVIDPTDVPEYRPSLNDLTGPGGTIFANFYNAFAEGGCLSPGSCGLFFERENGGSYVFGGVNTDTFENIPGGHYEIVPAPIPLPAAGGLMLAGLAALAWIRSRRA